MFKRGDLGFNEYLFCVISAKTDFRFKFSKSHFEKQANFFGKNIVKKLKDKIRYIFHIMEIFLILYFEKDDRI